MIRVSSLDAGMLYAETPEMPMHTMGVLMLDAPGRPIFDVCRRVVQQRLHLLAPFRRRLVEDPLQLGDPYWIEDPEFSIDHQGALWRCCATGQPWPDIEPGIADKITLAKVGSVKRIATVWEARCVMRRQRFSRDWSSCNHAVPAGACRTH